MHTNCTPKVTHILTTNFTQIAQKLHKIFPQIAHNLQTNCTQNEHGLDTDIIRVSHKLHMDCTWNAYNQRLYMYRDYTRFAQGLHKDCTHILCMFHTDCTQIEHVLHTDCIPIRNLPKIFSKIKQNCNKLKCLEIGARSAPYL